MRKTLTILISTLLLSPLSVLAVEGPSLDLGKSLFESNELGTKQRSCNTCHGQGKGLDKIGDFNDEELKDIINACIRDAVGGKLMAIDSQEMNDLFSYVRTFQKN